MTSSSVGGVCAAPVNAVVCKSSGDGCCTDGCDSDLSSGVCCDVSVEVSWEGKVGAPGIGDEDDEAH